MRTIRVIAGAALLALSAACGPEPEAVALAESACQTLEGVQNEAFDPIQLDAYNAWFEANEADINSLATSGGSADYEASLREECGPTVEAFAVAFQDHTGVPFWQTSAGP